ncbi:MAG TPA: hypothetical protein VFV38_42230 [Ktedonobacteraceae bacterium]|nr:hypothetical protein [Ktedonobacteraceae bacterium]
MPKKTTYSRGGAQRSKTRQKSFELVRPVSDEHVLETVEESSEKTADSEATEQAGEKVEAEVEVKSASESAPAAASSANSAPKSAAARMAARRQAAQKTQRVPASLIAAENYGYVRKDLLFILILAIIMFSAIIIMHFIPAIGG